MSSIQHVTMFKYGLWNELRPGHIYTEMEDLILDNRQIVYMCQKELNATYLSLSSNQNAPCCL